jgi:hypothetical protein
LKKKKSHIVEGTEDFRTDILLCLTQEDGPQENDASRVLNVSEYMLGNVYYFGLPGSANCGDRHF